MPVKKNNSVQEATHPHSGKRPFDPSLMDLLADDPVSDDIKISLVEGDVEDHRWDANVENVRALLEKGVKEERIHSIFLDRRFGCYDAALDFAAACGEGEEGVPDYVEMLIREVRNPSPATVAPPPVDEIANTDPFFGPPVMKRRTAHPAEAARTTSDSVQIANRRGALARLQTLPSPEKAVRECASIRNGENWLLGNVLDRYSEADGSIAINRALEHFKFQVRDFDLFEEMKRGKIRETWAIREARILRRLRGLFDEISYVRQLPNGDPVLIFKDGRVFPYAETYRLIASLLEVLDKGRCQKVTRQFIAEVREFLSMQVDVTIPSRRVAAYVPGERALYLDTDGQRLIRICGGNVQTERNGKSVILLPSPWSSWTFSDVTAEDVSAWGTLLSSTSGDGGDNTLSVCTAIFHSLCRGMSSSRPVVVLHGSKAALLMRRYAALVTGDADRVVGADELLRRNTDDAPVVFSTATGFDASTFRRVLNRFTMTSGPSGPVGLVLALPFYRDMGIVHPGIVSFQVERINDRKPSVEIEAEIVRERSVGLSVVADLLRGTLVEYHALAPHDESGYEAFPEFARFFDAARKSLTQVVVGSLQPPVLPPNAATIQPSTKALPQGIADSVDTEIASLLFQVATEKRTRWVLGDLWKRVHDMASAVTKEWLDEKGIAEFGKYLNENEEPLRAHGVEVTRPDPEKGEKPRCNRGKYVYLRRCSVDTSEAAEVEPEGEAA